MLANASATPISVSMFGKKSAIHRGLWVGQSISDELPVAKKYP